MRWSTAARTTLLAALVGCGDRGPQLASVALPGTGLTLAIERRVTHAFLAEFDRSLLLRAGDQTVARQLLFMDTGGYGRANLYRMGDSAWVVRDAEASYVVRPEPRAIRRDTMRRAADPPAFVGAFDADSSGYWRFIPAAERPELPTEFRGG